MGGRKYNKLQFGAVYTQFVQSSWDNGWLEEGSGCVAATCIGEELHHSASRERGRVTMRGSMGGRWNDKHVGSLSLGQRLLHPKIIPMTEHSIAMHLSIHTIPCPHTQQGYYIHVCICLRCIAVLSVVITDYRAIYQVRVHTVKAYMGVAHINLQSVFILCLKCHQNFMVSICSYYGAACC